jgi:hypothetical protein
MLVVKSSLSPNWTTWLHSFVLGWECLRHGSGVLAAYRSSAGA